MATLPHLVDGGDGGGAHACSGPAGAPACAPATGALDDAMRSVGIPWRGNWDPSFRDFFIDRIGPFASAAPDRYWSLTVNGHFSGGGCLARVGDGDSVRFHLRPPLCRTPRGSTVQPGDPRARKPKNRPRRETGPLPARLRRITARAEKYLRRSPGTVGADWARLALALRREGGLAVSPP